MNSPMRIAAAAATAALVLGSGGAATAGSGGNHGQPDNATHGHGHGGDDGSHAVAHLQEQLKRQLERLGDRLDKATRESRLAPLAEDVRAGLLANVAADHADLADLAALVDAATTRDELSDLRKQVRAVRPENYDVLVADLRLAARLSTRIAELRTAVVDPTVLASLDEADALVGTATDKALAVTAASSKADLKAVKADLVAAKQLADEVDDTP
ncbi:MAG: hypothetical protein JWO11_3290 [Nocardioides sp.]|nr:hypothetical protein [Nocardioides sp.]